MEWCPKCGSNHTHRVEVDIGVGVQKGPLECSECGYSEDDPEAFTVYDFEDWEEWNEDQGNREDR